MVKPGKQQSGAWVDLTPDRAADTLSHVDTAEHLDQGAGPF
jgi:hypothetical protein